MTKNARTPPPTADQNRALKRRLQRLAWLTDSAIPLPGGYSIGLDGIIGLIPGLGDAIGAIMSGYIVVEGTRAGAPASVVIRMIGNVLLETIIGWIPFAGDLFDIVFKANQRNVALLDRYLDQPDATRRSSKALLASLFAFLIIWSLGIIWVSVQVLLWFVSLIA
tara:strand:+ start:99418 stop:99912 length:495 start_codon:yes stop_codon:yes gene_type:complete